MLRNIYEKMCQLLIFFSQWIIKLLFLLDLTYFIHVKRYQGMDGAMVGLGGAMAPPNFFFKILLNIWVLILAILF